MQLDYKELSAKIRRMTSRPQIIIKDELTRDEIAWIARDGVEAVARCAEDRPDLILMDLIMPKMDGVEATRRIMASTPCAIVVVTANVNDNASKVFEAMGAGALDAVNTPVLESPGNGNGANALLAKVETIRRLLGAGGTRKQAPSPETIAPSPVARHDSLVAIGASAGGPAALAKVLAHLPPDFPAGENPPDGAMIDYYLQSASSSPVTLEIKDAAAKTVRKYSSADKPDPIDPMLAIPTYWIRPPQILSAAAGSHRFVWDLHYPPPEGGRRSYPMAAIYRDTPSEPSGPWVLPGQYLVRLTVGGRSSICVLISTTRPDRRSPRPPVTR